MQTDSLCIMTTRAESAQYAIAEMQKYDTQIRPMRELALGVRLMTLPGGWARFVTDAHPLIFVRHIFPVQYSTRCDAELNVDALLNALDIPVCGDGTTSFAVQTRGGVPLAWCADIEAALQNCGFEKNVKHPEWVVSLFTHKNEAGELVLYAGASTVAANRSRWNGGAAHYANDGVLSRAAHKLTEALEAFGLAEKAMASNALDLGAAPGGWTQVLLDKGAQVTAVDPGVMDARLANHPHMHYVCATAQRFFAEAIKSKNATRYDLIVNDMKMDMYESARIMVDAAFLLASDGYAIMTFKLKPGQGFAKIKKALDILVPGYRVVGVRQLFHNRDEVTVCLTR